MPILLYAPTALALLWLTQRFVRPLSRTAALLLFLLPFAFTGHALVANRVYAPIDRTFIDLPLSDLKAAYGIGEPHNPIVTDIYSQMIPWRYVVREALRRGEWPLWNPYILCGDILAASAQSAPYSPFTLIACLIPAAISFTFTAAITFFLAALGAFAFARELDLAEGASMIAAAGWMCSTSIVLYVLWPLGLCWALLPLILLATRRVVRAPGVTSWALLATTLTLLLVAGHPESVLHIVFVGATYGLFELLQRWRSAPRALATAIAAGATSLLLTAIYLLPIAEAIPQTAEYDYRHAIFAKAGWRSAPSVDVFTRLATDVFPFLHLRMWTRPAIRELKGETAAAGSILLALAVYAVWRVRSREAWFFAVFGAFCAVAATEFGPVMRTFQKVPLFDIALHERLAFAAALCLVMLAAIGADTIVRRGDRRAAAITFAILLALLAAGTFWITHTFTIENRPVDWGAYKIPAELALLAAVIIALRLPPRAVGPALLALILVQRVASEGGIWKSFPARAAYPPVPLFAPMRKVREPFRVVGRGSALVPGTNALYGLEDVRGYEAMTLDHYHRIYRLWCEPQSVWFNRVDDLSNPLLSMMNVRFAVATPDAPLPDGWRRVAAQRQSVLLENANVIERAFVPRNVTISVGDGLAMNEMSAQRDFRDRAWIDANEPPAMRANGPGVVTIRRPALAEFALDVTMENDGWLVLTESDWEGWRAYLDGRRVSVHRANVAFLSAFVPRGRHDVRFVYRPRSFVVGRTISAATLAAIIVFAIIRRRVTRRASFSQDAAAG